MAHFLILRLIIGLISIYCESVSGDTEGLPNDEETALLSEGAEMNDDELWNLLKQISRNGSDQDPLEGFTDYEEYTLVDELYTTDVTEQSLVDNTEIEFSTKTGLNTATVDFESTRETTTLAAKDSVVTTEYEPSEETVEYETPLDILDNLTVSNEVTEAISDTSTAEDLNETENVITTFSTQPTIYLSSTIIPILNVSNNSSLGSTIIPSTSVSPLLPDELNNTETSLGPKVPGNFMKITTTTIASVATTIRTADLVTESTTKITNKESTIVTSDVTSSPVTTKQNGSFEDITSSSVDSDKSFTKYDSTLATLLTTTSNDVSEELISSSTTVTDSLPSGSSETKVETTTPLSMNIKDSSTSLPAVTEESRGTDEFEKNTSTSIETSPTRSTISLDISSVTIPSVATSPFNTESDELFTPPTVNSTDTSKKVTSTLSTPTVISETSESTVFPKPITTSTTPSGPILPNTMESTKVTISESTATKPFKEEIDKFSATPSTVNSTNVYETLSSVLTTTPAVTTDTSVSSESPTSPVTIVTERPTSPNTMKSVKVTGISESTVTKPFNEVTIEVSATAPTVTSTNFSGTFSSVLTTVPAVTTKEWKISESTAFLPSTVTGSSLSTVSTTMKAIKVFESKSTATEPLTKESTASATTINNLTDKLISTSTTPLIIDHNDINGITSVHINGSPSTVPDKNITPVTIVSVASITGDQRDVMTTVSVPTAQMTERSKIASTTPFSVSTLTNIPINKKSSKTEENSVSEQITVSTTTESVVASEKSTLPSVGTISFTPKKNNDSEKKYTGTKISNNFSTVSTPLTTIKINDVTKNAINRNYIQTKPPKTLASNVDQELDVTTEMFKLKATTEKVSTTASTATAVFSTFTKATTAKTKMTVPTSRPDKNLPTKKKISLDPSKKIFISIEDPLIPQLNLREKSSVTPVPQIKETTRVSLKKTDFYPQLKNTVPPQHKETLEPGRKVYLIPENKDESLFLTHYPQHMPRKHAIPDRNENIGVTTVQPCSTCKDSSGKSNLDRSRIFMIDEATLTPMKIDLPPLVPCCAKKLNQDKHSQNEPKGHKVPHIQIPYFKFDETKANPEMKKDCTDSHQSTESSLGEKNLETKTLKNGCPKKKKSFDPNRMHTLDTSPPETSIPSSIITPITMKKSALDKNRKFVIDSDDTVTGVKPKNNDKELSYNKKTMTRPVIQIIPSINMSQKDKTNLDQNKSVLPQGYDEDIKYKISPPRLKPQQSIPELLCFEVKNKDRKPILSCIPLNSTIKTNFMHFLNNVEPHNHHQKAPILRKVVLKNQTPVATSVIIKTMPAFNKMKYTISGHVLNTGNNNLRGSSSMKTSFNTPDRQVFVSNNQMQDIVRHSIIPIKHIASKQNLLFLEQPPNPGSYQQIFSSTLEKSVISNRAKRSVKNNCNFDGVYEDEGSSLAFVFDNTGSMSPELEQMRETAKTITKELTEKKRNLIKDYILVTFNDPGNNFYFLVYLIFLF